MYILTVYESEEKNTRGPFTLEEAKNVKTQLEGKSFQFFNLEGEEVNI